MQSEQAVLGQLGGGPVEESLDEGGSLHLLRPLLGLLVCLDVFQGGRACSLRLCFLLQSDLR